MNIVKDALSVSQEGIISDFVNAIGRFTEEKNNPLKDWGKGDYSSIVKRVNKTLCDPGWVSRHVKLPVTSDVDFNHLFTINSRPTTDIDSIKTSLVELFSSLQAWRDVLATYDQALEDLNILDNLYTKDSINHVWADKYLKPVLDAHWPGSHQPKVSMKIFGYLMINDKHSITRSIDTSVKPSKKSALTISTVDEYVQWAKLLVYIIEREGELVHTWPTWLNLEDVPTQALASGDDIKFPLDKSMKHIENYTSLFDSESLDDNFGYCDFTVVEWVKPHHLTITSQWATALISLLRDDLVD